MGMTLEHGLILLARRETRVWAWVVEMPRGSHH